MNLVDQSWQPSLRGHSGYISCLEVLSGGVRIVQERCQEVSDPVLFSSSLDGSVRVWRIGFSHPELVATLEHHRRKAIHKLLVDRQQRCLYTSSSDKTICRQSLDALGEAAVRICELDDWVACMAFVATDRLLVGLHGGALYEIDAGEVNPRQAVLRKFSGHTKITTSVAVCQGHAFSAGGDGFVRCWDLTHGSMCFEVDVGSPIYAMRPQRRKLELGHTSAVQVLAGVSPEACSETNILVGTKTGKLLRLDAMGQQLHCYVDHGGTVFDLATGLNGELLSAGQNGIIYRTIPAFRCEFCLKACKPNGMGCLPGTCSSCGIELFEPDLSEHLVKCIKEKCPQCGEEVSKGKALEHAVSCPGAPVRCKWPGCGAWVPRYALDCHEQKECLHREVACPNRPCDHLGPLCLLDQHVLQCEYCSVEVIPDAQEDLETQNVCSSVDAEVTSQEEMSEPVMPPKTPPPQVVHSQPTSQQSPTQPSRLSAFVAERRVGGGFVTDISRLQPRQRTGTSGAVRSIGEKSHALKRFATIGTTVTGSMRLSRQRDTQKSVQTPSSPHKDSQRRVSVELPGSTGHGITPGEKPHKVRGARQSI